MYCESCGSFIPDGQSFCSNCGTPVSAPAAQPAPAPAPVAAAPVVAAAPAPAPAPAPAAQPVQPVYQQPQAQPVQPVYQPVYQQAQSVQPVYQPVYQPAYQQASATNAKRANGAATAALVFGIIAFVLFWIPFFNIFTTGILGLLGLIFSIVGLAKKNAGGKAKAVVGLVLTILAIAATVGYYGLVWQAIVSDPELSEEWEEIFEDVNSTGEEDIDSNTFYIDGDYLKTDNGYVTGVLHIDGYRVDF